MRTPPATGWALLSTPKLLALALKLAPTPSMQGLHWQLLTAGPLQVFNYTLHECAPHHIVIGDGGGRLLLVHRAHWSTALTR